MERWDELVADTDWRQGKRILELESEQTPDELCDVTVQWMRKHAVLEEKHV